MNLMGFLPIIIPSALAIIFAVLTIILKKHKDSMTGIAKESSEFLLTVVDALKDRVVTPEELQKMIDEMGDVIEEARKLLNKES